MMESIEYFFELIKKSDISLLGYRPKNERLKDEIISKLPHLVVLEIDSSFSFKSFLRDLKLKSILETIIMQEESMKVIKNRFGDNNIDISYNKLKDYNYICNYENNN